MPVLVLVRPVIFDSEPDALLQPSELESGEQASQRLIPHALPVLTIGLAGIEDDLAVGELGSYGAGQVCYRVLLCGQQGQRLLQLLLLIAGAVEGDP